MEIKYNTPIEVTKRQYIAVASQLEGICAHREDNGKYFVKILLIKYKKYLAAILNTI